MRALVTGAGGFVGGRLARELARRGWEVTGTALQGPEAADDARAVRWVCGDVRDPAHLARALDAARPDAIFHLAGVTHVPTAAGDPGLAMEVNAVAAARLLALVRERRHAGTLDPAIVVVGSAEQYGRHDAAELPLPETAEQRPHGAYAASKVAQEAVALAAFRSDGLRVIATRSFNHSGAGQNPRFLLPALVGRAIALRDVPEGERRLTMGNQSPVRDYLHVSDVVAAYIALAERGTPGEAYNVASGVGTSAGELARRVLRRLGLDAPIETDPAHARPADVPALVGAPAKLRAATGWAPRHTLDDILDDLIQHHDATPQ